jgi:hypothetical protein
MATQYIKFKRSAIPGKRPSNSQMELGELALNTNDGRLFTKKENVGIGTTVTLLNVWTENVGGGAYYTDGNIGIGITNPIQQVQVGGIGTNTGLVISGFGSIGITTNNPVTYIDISSNTPTRNTVQFGSFGIQSFDNVNGFLSNNGYWDGEKWIYRRNGHSSLLQFLQGNILLRTLPVGTAGSSGNIDTRIAVQNNGNIGINTNNPLLQLQIGPFNSSSIVGVTSVGLVGIGTTNPTSRLHISGDSLVTGVVTATAFNGNINAGIGTITNLSGTNVSYSGIGTIGTLDVNSADIDNLNTINISNSGIITTSNLVVNNEFDVYAPDSTFHDNVVIQGNLTVNGTQVILNVDDKFIKDKQIVLGFSTTNNVDDTTANGGGFGIASTEGSPLVCLQCTGINTLPSTYKQLIWTKANTFGAGTTDAFLFNYAVGIGSTLVPNGVRLSVGGVKITDSDVNATTFTGSGANLTSLNASNISSGTLDNARLPQNISVSGVITATTFSGNLQNTLTLNTSGTGLSGSATFNNSSSSTFTVTSNATSNNTGGTIVARNANGGFSAGIVTATFVGNVTGNLNSSGVNTAATLSGTTLTYTTGTFDNINVSGITTTALLNVGVGGTIITTTSNGSVGIGTNVELDTNNPNGLSVLGKILTGNSISSPNILNTVFPSVGTGHSAYRPLNLVDTSAAIKIVRTHNDFGAIVDLHQWNAGITTMLSYWDLVSEQGTFSIRDRLGAYDSTKPQLSRIFINEFGNVLINASNQAIGPNRTQSVGYGTANVLQVNGNTFIGGSIGIGTTNPTSQLHVIGPNFPLARIERVTNLTSNRRSTVSAIHRTSADMVDGFGADISFGIVDSSGIDNEIANFGAIRDGADNSGALVFSTSLNGTTLGLIKMILKSNGNLGIGTTNPTSRLHIIGDALVTGVVTATAFNGNINAGVGTITNLSGTNVSYSGIGTVGSLNIGSTQVISSARELQNIASLDATTTATIETAIANAPNTFTDLQVTGVSTFTNGPVLIGSGTSTGVSEQRLQVTGGGYISGSLGIGTTAPRDQGTLEVVSTIPGGGIRVSSFGTNSPGFRLVNNETGAFSQNLLALGFGNGLVGAVPGDYCIRNSAGGGILLGISTSLGVTSPNQANGYVRLTPSGEFLIGTASTITTGTLGQNLQVTGGAYISDNTGIGTTNPTSKLTVQGDVSIASTVSIGSSIDIIPYDNLGTLSFEGSAGQLFSITNNLTSGSIFSVNDVSGIPSIDVDADGTVQIATYGGNLGVGTTNPTSKLTVQGDVLVSGVITSTDYNSASDINLKENIQPIENPIDKVLNITGVSFDWKEDGRSSMGVIAQEVERVLPELVSGSDTKTVNYNGLIGLLIEVVKDQQKEINMLKESMKRL